MINLSQISVYRHENLASLVENGTEDFRQALMSLPYRPIGENEAKIMTFMPVNGLEADNPEYFYEIKDAGMKLVGALLRVNVAKRIVPKPAIIRKLNEQIKEYKQRFNEEPTKQHLKEWKEDIHEKLLKKVLPTEKVIDVMFDFKASQIYVGVSSASVAEDCFALIRRVLQSFPVVPAVYEKSVSSILNNLFIEGQMQFTDGRIVSTQKFKLMEMEDNANTVTNNMAECPLDALHGFVQDGLMSIKQIDVFTDKLSCTFAIPNNHDTLIQFKGIKTGVESLLEERNEGQEDISKEELMEDNRQFMAGHLLSCYRNLLAITKEMFGGYQIKFNGED